MTSLKSYITGFLLSLILTLLAYFLVTHGIFKHAGNLTAAVLILAVTQLILQLKFFLHLNFKEQGRWNLIFLISTFSIVFIVVIGSLWIMNHLNYNMMPTDKEIIMDEGMHK